MANNEVTLSSSEVTERVITNLYLYGQVAPPAYQDRLRSVATPNTTLKIILEPSYFTSGSGQYAYVARSEAVKSVFLGAGIFRQLTLGQTYSVADLKGRGATDADFRFSFQQVQQGLFEAGYTARTYIYNTQTYEISDDTLFYYNGENSYISNLSVRPRPEDFDFVTGNPLVSQVEGVLLEGVVDPFRMGRKVLMEYLGNPGYYNDSLKTYYDITDYNNENAAISATETNLLDALIQATPPLRSLVNQLSLSDYKLANGRVIYGSNSSDAINASYISTHIPLLSPETYDGTGDDIVVAGEGNDAITDYAGNDTYYGGAGDDKFGYASGNDVYYGGDGNDGIGFDVAGSIAVRLGGGVVEPGDTANVTYGLNTARLNSIESIFGSAQNDVFTVASVPKDMFADGAAGGDALVLGELLAGITVYDTFQSLTIGGYTLHYQNFEIILGTTLNDIFYINRGGRTLRGDAGNDRFQIENYTADLNGAVLDGGAGANVIETGDYADISGATLTNLQTLQVNSAYGLVLMSVAQLNGFSAINAVGGSVVIGLTTGGTYNLSNLSLTGAITLQALTTEALTATGTSGDDQMYGWSSDDATLYGVDGNDTLIAGTGRSRLYGGNGDDYLVMLGGPRSLGDILDGGAGNNTLDVAAHTDLSVMTLRNLQKLTVEGEASLTAAQFNLFVQYMAYGGSATLQAKTPGTYNLSGKTTSGKINLKGSTGGDVLVGDAKAQTIEGGAGIDQLTGGGGADIFKFSTLTDSQYPGAMDLIADFTIGVDKIDVTGLGFTGLTAGTAGAGQLKLRYDSYYNFTYVYDTGTGFGFYMAGNKLALTAADFIGLPPSATVTISGTAGNDVLTGSNANDMLLGYAGADQLIGNGGNDVLDGGAGVDQLTGGAGMDVFRFMTLADSLFASGMDRIADFVKGEDRIDLAGLGFTGVTTGTPTAGQLKLSFDAYYNHTYLRDLNGSGFGFYLTGNQTSLTSSDMIGLG